MKHITLLILGLYLLNGSGYLNAQDLNSFTSISYITADNGLSQGEVTRIIQDQKGFLWIGTRGGLNRYDGYQFEVFKNEIGNPNSLINNSVESLFEDRKGNIWIGTKSGGVSCYNPAFDVFTHHQTSSRDTNTISGNRVISIAEDQAGKIWLGTWYNGFSIYDPEKNTYTRRLPGVQVSDIVPTDKGEIWIATQLGLYLFDQAGNQLHHYINGQNPGDYEKIIVDKEQNCLWIGSWNSGLVRFDLNRRTFFTFEHGPGSPFGPRANIAYTIAKDEAGRIWVGTWGGGLLIFDPRTQQFTKKELATGPYQNAKLVYSEVLCIFQDRSGVTWIGTNGGGLCKINRNENYFGLIQGSTGVPGGFPSNNPVWSILEDHEGTLWIGTKGNGYLSYSRDKGRNFDTLSFPGLEKFSNGRILGSKALFRRQDNTVWAGTHHGLYQIQTLSEGKYQLTRAFNEPGQSIRGMKVSSMAETADGSFWIGTQHSGLNRFTPKEGTSTLAFQHYRALEDTTSLQNQRVSTMLTDRSDRLWVGTYGGLHLYLPETNNFRVFTKTPGDLRSLSSNIILYLHEDRQNRLWIGTPNGLNLAISDAAGNWHFRSFQEADGIPNNYIQSILEDDHGHLWISTNKGITKFDPEKEVFYSYDVSDGLQANSFSEGAAWKGKDGTLYFGGIYGLNYFLPDSIINEPAPPPVFITGFRIFNQEVAVGKSFNKRVILEKELMETEKIILTHRENVFSLEFTALNLRMPHKNAYQYRLLGLEEDWNEVGDQRNVTYTNLRPGTYTFQVNAANNNQYWEENITSMQIQVLPPFWATWQAYVIYALLLVSLLGLYHHITSRQNQLKRNLELAQLERTKDAEVAELKTRFFTNITHELRTPLTLISGPVEELVQEEKIVGKPKDYLFTIHHHTQRLLALVNQLLDFRKAESGNMELQAAPGNMVAFAREVFLSFQPLADKQNIDFQFRAPAGELALYFDRDKMEIVLCNLLSNAFKHTPAGQQIEVSIREAECPGDSRKSSFPAGCCEISIRDNGSGMPKELVDKIFNRFYQIANTDSVKVMGTGIGLSLVESIVQLHRGKVEVQAEPGLGSEFTVHLPLGKAHLQPDQIISNFRNSDDLSQYSRSGLPDRFAVALPIETRDTNPNIDSKIKLLIVEDNPRIRQFIHRIFEDQYQILEAEHGKAAWEIARQDQPDLIISDVMMPEMDGITLCRMVKDHQATCHIPVILLTARTSNVFQVEGFHSGADAYVTKPFQPRVLRAQVAGMLEARQRLREYFSRKVTLQPSDIEITPADEAFIKSAIEVIESHLDNEALGKEFLAQALAMSPSSLYRRIKSITDLSINAFIRSIRLRRAAQLIQNTQYNISEICYQVGFNDQKYFRKCFREQFGRNPSEYAEQAV